MHEGDGEEDKLSQNTLQKEYAVMSINQDTRALQAIAGVI